ncbi:hypothetical protein [Rhizobium sp.]
MGLEIARTMLASHGATITLQNSSYRGTEFLVTIPQSRG